jgi:hypothetical protein
MLGDLNRIAARTLEDGDRRRSLVVEKRAQRIGVSAELDARNVL